MRNGMDDNADDLKALNNNQNIESTSSVITDSYQIKKDSAEAQLTFLLEVKPRRFNCNQFLNQLSVDTDKVFNEDRIKPL